MKNIDQLLDKYWAGLTSPAEEAEIRTYFKSGQVDDAHADLAPLFMFFNREAERKMPGTLDLDQKSDNSRPRIIRLIPRLIAIAASVAVLLSVSLHFFNPDEAMYKNKYTELQDPDEALAITMEALGFLSTQYEKGAQPMTKHFKKIEKTAVFDMN